MPWNLCEKDLQSFCEPVLGDRNEGLKFIHSIATVFNQTTMNCSCLGPFHTKMFAELLRKEEGIFESHFIYKFNERLLFSKVCAGIYRKTLKKGNCVFASHGYLTSIDRYTIPRTWLPVIPKAYDVPPPIPWPWSPSRWMKLWREWHRNAQVGRDLFDRYCKMFSWCINLFNSNAGIPTFYNLASFCGRIVNAKLLNEYLQLFARKMTTMVTQARARGWKKQSRPRAQLATIISKNHQKALCHVQHCFF